MNVLVINAGSSSLKYQLIDMDNEKVLAKGSLDRIGQEESCCIHKSTIGINLEKRMYLSDHKDAMKEVLEYLLSSDCGAIESISDVSAVGHRVVHGGEIYSEAVLIDVEVLKVIKNKEILAPLHNPANIVGIIACEELMPTTPMIAVFDTAFHQTMPSESFLYALPYELYQKHSIRKYGFHGSSHKFVTRYLSKLLNYDLKGLRIISCHLGNGSSIAAIKSGISIDTSMGFTPLEGLPMGTRCGNIDPAIITFLMKNENISIERIEKYLNKESGILGISGISSDFRDLFNSADNGNKRAKLAIDVFITSVKKYIGAYTALMGGLDYVIFTAGFGENCSEGRRLICEGLEFLGISIDEVKNEKVSSLSGNGFEISSDDSKVKVYVIPTNEELMIAREARDVLLSEKVDLVVN